MYAKKTLINIYPYVNMYANLCTFSAMKNGLVNNKI